MLKVLGTLLSDVDEFETTAVIAEKQRASVMLRVRVGDVEATGVADMAVDDKGLVARISVQWHPLEKIVAIQQKLPPR